MLAMGWGALTRGGLGVTSHVTGWRNLICGRGVGEGRQQGRSSDENLGCEEGEVRV